MAKDKTASAARVGESPAPEGAGDGAEVNVDKLVVRSLVAGFRRAGRAWPAEEVEVDISEFTAEQIAQLLAEPKLVVLPISAE